MKKPGICLAFSFGKAGLNHPALHCIGAELGFPSFEGCMVSTLGLNHFTSVRVLVALQFPRRPLRLSGFGNGFAGALRVEDSNHVAQVFAVFSHQRFQLALELELLLQRVIVLQIREALLQLIDGFFCLAVLVYQTHAQALLGLVRWHNSAYQHHWDMGA